MASPPVQINLIRKRAELAGEVVKAQAHLDRLIADLAAMDRVLDITGYEGDPEAIPAKTRGSLRERDEYHKVWQFVLGMLTNATKPLRASTIARAYMAETGVAGADPRTVEYYRYKVVNALRSMRRKGITEMEGKCMGATWRLVSGQVPK